MKHPTSPLLAYFLNQYSISRILWLTLILIGATQSWGQLTNVSTDQAQPLSGAGHDYIHFLNETVNPSTGAVSVRIGVPMPPGRLLTIPFAFGYDSTAAHHLLVPGQASPVHRQDNLSYLGQGGWSYLVPQLSMLQNDHVVETSQNPPQFSHCAYFTDYMFTEAGGTTHSLNLSAAQQSGSVCTAGFGQPNHLSGGDVHLQAVAADGAALNNPTAVTVADIDGTVYYFSNSTNRMHTFDSSVSNGWSSLPDWIETRNGNKATFADGGNGAFSITDSIGRTALSSSGFGQSGNTVSISGLPNPYTVTWGTSNSSWAYNTRVHDDSTTSSCGSGNTLSLSLPEITAINLPNGQSYQFQYDSTSGLLSKLIYPTGGYVRYVWGTNTLSDSIDFYPNLAGQPTCQEIHDTQAISHRYVSFDGSSEVLEQDFTYSTSWTPESPSTFERWTGKTTTVVTTDLVRNTSFTTIYSYVPVGVSAQPNDSLKSGGGVVPVENTVSYYDTTGSLLRTTTKAYFDAQLPPDETISLDNGLTSQTTHTYADALFPNFSCSFGHASPCVLTDEAEYDYGTGQVGSLLQKRHFNYQSFPATPIFSGNSSLLDRPCQVITYDGGNTRVAEQDFEYDGGTTICGVSGSATTGLVENLAGHDETNYASGSTTPRGNVTSAVVQCLLTTGQPCSQATLLTSYSYDETGQVISKTDPANNPPTTYSYANSFTDTTPSTNTNAYLTQIAYPTTNGVNHVEKYSFAYVDGQLTQSIDQNNQTTGYVYSDALRRLTETDYPAPFGKSTIAYTDTALAVSIETTRQIDAAHSTDVIVRYDGAGHEISQSTANGESIPWDRIDTCYDGLGRVKFRSYPFQIPSSTTDPNCLGAGDTSVYDSLGRIKSVTHSDGSVMDTTYTGRATDVKDEGNGARRVERISQFDGLGLLRYVCEVTGQSQQGVAPSACGLDASGTGFLTSYGYTPLGDLQTVSQGALSRSFQYDSLSRLTQSNNPESATTNYSYDSDSNCAAQSSYPGELISKLDARGARTCFTHDPLHRLTGKTYITTGTTAASTPAITYNYDEPLHYGRNLTFTVGRKTSESTAAPNPTGEVFSYDAMGNVIDNSQCTPQNCGNNTAFAVTYPTYDDLGNVLSATNGVGVSIGYTYNAVGRLYHVSSTLNDSSHPGTLLDNVHYNAFGLPTTSSIGAVPLTDTRDYTSRGFPKDITVAGPSTTPSSGTITINGSEQRNTTSNATSGRGSITFGGSDRTTTVYVVCGPNGTTCGHTEPDYGTISVTVNGATATYSYGPSTTAAGLASFFASSFSSVTGTVSSGTTVNFVATGTGSATNYPLSSSCTSGSPHFSGCSFGAAPSGPALTGGTDAQYAYDGAVVYANINGFLNQSQAFNSGSSSTSVASQLASDIHTRNPYVDASASGNVITLQSRVAGAFTNYSFQAYSSSTYSPQSFPPSTTGQMGGGTGGLYNVSIGYHGNGDVQTANDTINGNWSYTYDDFNRLNTAVAGNISTGCSESYDRYGNRWSQQPYGGSGYGCNGFTASFASNNNQFNPGQGYGYDLAGNINSAGNLSYTYDAENRIVTVSGASQASYVYNAEGQRIRKTSSAGTVDYLHDLSGHTITELSSAGAWNRGEVYAGGMHLATYMGGVTGTTNFTHSDWLGNERVRSDVAGGANSPWTNLPFGEGSNTPNPSPTHFTGKERDTESTLDYFGARYYWSTTGRWMSPDWSDNPEPVPFTDLNDPQSLNLYGYVRNNPISHTDPDGHGQVCGQQTSTTDKNGTVTVDANCKPDEMEVWAGYASQYNPHAQQMLAWSRYLTPQRMAVTEAYFGIGLLAMGGDAEAGFEAGGVQTLRSLLTSEEQAEYLALEAKYPDWMPKDGLDTPVSIRTVEENAAARAEVTGTGHHAQPLKFGGNPNPAEGLVRTGETRTLKNPTHTEVTKFWNGVLRRIEAQSGRR